MISRRFEIADGFGNEHLAKPLSELYECFLKWADPYLDDNLFEWYDYESRELNGKRRYVNIGLPWVVLVLPIMSMDEHYEFKDDFGEEVTVQLYNRTEREWKYYNGILVHPENPQLDAERREFLEVRYEIRELVEIL